MVNRVVLAVSRLLPVYSDEQTFAVNGMSRTGQAPAAPTAIYDRSSPDSRRAALTIVRSSTVCKPSAVSAKLANDFENRLLHIPLTTSKRGHSMSGNAILENVRRYRTIASLCRQTAAFRPAQKWTLLEQAYEWERRAISELEGYFAFRDGASRWEVPVAA